MRSLPGRENHHPPPQPPPSVPWGAPVGPAGHTTVMEWTLVAMRVGTPWGSVRYHWIRLPAGGGPRGRDGGNEGQRFG